MRKYLLLLVIVGTTCLSGRSGFPNDNGQGMVSFLRDYLEIKYNNHQFDELLYIAAKQQKMYYIKGSKIIASFSVSTAKNGIGSGSGSQQTPTGLHRIKEKVGDGVPWAGVIREKTYTGEIATIIEEPVSGKGDQITTRLLHLEGLEPGSNKGVGCDSYSRGIMIHGTPEEGLIGSPASHGCVRMKNDDILHLFDTISSGTYVVILNN